MYIDLILFFVSHTEFIENSGTMNETLTFDFRPIHFVLYVFIILTIFTILN